MEKIRFNAGNLDDKDRAEYELIRDPITLEIINDPVSVSSGITYDRKSLTDYFIGIAHEEARCPVTKIIIKKSELDNKSHVITKNMIASFVSKQEKLKQLPATCEFGIFATGNEKINSVDGKLSQLQL